MSNTDSQADKSPSAPRVFVDSDSKLNIERGQPLAPVVLLAEGACKNMRQKTH